MKTFMLVDDRWLQSKEICPHCKKTFNCYRKPQIPGFRDAEDMICPYCDKLVKTSMEWEFYTETIL